MAWKDCDVCDGDSYSLENPFVMMCQQRPSDHSDMCCTLAGHWLCLTRGDEPLPSIGDTNGIATPSQWESWIESAEAAKAGYAFLT